MKIFFVGVCGTAMGNVAILMKKLGHDVLGSDKVQNVTKLIP